MGIEKSNILTDKGAEICGAEFGNLPRKKLLISHMCVSKCGHYGHNLRSNLERNLIYAQFIKFTNN